MGTAIKLQFVKAYRELGRIPTELVADYTTVKWMDQGYTYKRSTELSNRFILDYSRWFQSCTIDEFIDKLTVLVDAYISLKEEGLYDDF